MRDEGGGRRGLKGQEILPIKTNPSDTGRTNVKYDKYPTQSTQIY
jgi:hypothetical protein